jgi:hypothetical protein
MTMLTNKPILCLDFDGVIHSYTSPWVDACTILDPVTRGFFDWALRAQEGFRLVIYSSRTKEPGAIDAMRKWLAKEYAISDPARFEVPMPEFTFAHEKPAAYLTIDDRAVRFDGDWKAVQLDPDVMLRFKPWNKR